MFYIIYGGSPAGGGLLSGGGITPSVQQAPDPGFVVKPVPSIFADPGYQPTAYSLQNYPNAIDRQRPFNDGVCMEVMHFDNVDREFVRSGDHTTYHYTRWTVTASLYVNPQRNDFSFFSSPNLPSIVESDITLRNFLKQDRKRLTIVFDSAMETTDSAAQAYEVLIDVPQNGYSVDHEEGPKVQMCNVKQCLGSGGYIVQLSVVFACDDSVNRRFNPSGQQGNYVPLLLSNRWSMTHTGSPDGYLIRNMEGTAVANVPELKRKNLVIDQLRSMIFPPVYPGMRRAYEVDVTPEGSTMTYRITDTQEPMTYIDDVASPPAAIAAQIATARTQNAAFSGVYFEGRGDANQLAQTLAQALPFGTPPPPGTSLPYAQTQDQSDLWFGNSSRRHVSSLTVQHYMGLIREGTEASVYNSLPESALGIAQGMSNTPQRDQYKAGPKGDARFNQDRARSRFNNRVNLGVGLGRGTLNSTLALDALVAKFIERVHVVAVCRPEGNLKRAFYLALSAAYGLANNTRTFEVDPYTLEVNIDYANKSVVVDISYSGVDYTTFDRRKSGSKKIAIGPQSYLVGGPLDANIKSDFRSVGTTVIGASTSGYGPNMNILGPNALLGTSSAQNFANGNSTIFPADQNAEYILSRLAKDDLPDSGKLLMMDQSQYGTYFPSYGPNGDQNSRSFMECFLPLFTAPLTSSGDYPVMLGRATFPHDANNGRSSSLSNFYNRGSLFLGDNQATTVVQTEDVQKVTWVNRVF